MNKILHENDDLVVPTNLLGLEAFNKGQQSQVVKTRQHQDQRRETVKNNTSLLAELQEKRHEESKKRGYPIPESRAECLCKQQIANIKDPNQVDVAALIYSYQNFAHLLFSTPAGDIISKHNRIALDSKRIVQAISNIKETTLKRQFLTQSKVPKEQYASTMWATMFSVLERINAIESVFSALKSLFHEVKQPFQFSCTNECVDAKDQFWSNCNGTPVEQLNCKARQAKARRYCVAESFFDQFYVPICFIRRNAFYKETQLELVTDVPLTRNEAPDHQAHRLMDVHFLSIFQLINLAMSSLEHLATLSAFPSATIYNLIEEAEEAKEAAEKNIVEKKKTTLQRSHLQTDLPFADNYEEWPENAQYRSDIDANLDVEIVVKNAFLARKRLQDKEEARIQQEKSDHIPSDAENVRRYRNYLQNQHECISLQDGVHDLFSDERVEVYRTFLPSNSVLDPSSNKATAIYSIMETKETRFGESAGGFSDPVIAMKHFFPSDTTRLNEFGKFCKESKHALLGGRGKNYLLDKDLTARLFAKFLAAESKIDPWVLSDDLKTTICNTFEKKINSQIETPNFRAWSSTVLQQLDSWLEQVQETIATDAIYWSRIQFGDDVSKLPAAKHATMQTYEEACKKMAPWLFDDAQSESMIRLLERRSMERSDDQTLFCREEAIINFQMAANCKRLWSIDSAIDYCNEQIMKKDNNFSNEDQQMWNAFGKNFESYELKQTIERDKDKEITKMLWTICCEPLLQGTDGFAVEPGADPICKDVLFSPNQKRNLKHNPNVQLHEYLWELFRNKWSSLESELLPQVAQLGNGVVDAFMQLKKIDVPQQQDCKYLLSDYKPIVEESERKKIAVRFFNIINDVEAYLPTMHIGVHKDILKIERMFGQSLEESRNSALSLLGYSTIVHQERSFTPALYEISRPFISLGSLSCYLTERLNMNASKFQKPVVMQQVENKAKEEEQILLVVTVAPTTEVTTRKRRSTTDSVQDASINKGKRRSLSAEFAMLSKK